MTITKYNENSENVLEQIKNILIEITDIKLYGYLKDNDGVCQNISKDNDGACEHKGIDILCVCESYYTEWEVEPQYIPAYNEPRENFDEHEVLGRLFDSDYVITDILVQTNNGKAEIFTIVENDEDLARPSNPRTECVDDCDMECFYE